MAAAGWGARTKIPRAIPKEVNSGVPAMMVRTAMGVTTAFNPKTRIPTRTMRATEANKRMMWKTTLAASHSGLLNFVVARSLKYRRERYSAQMAVIPNNGVDRIVNPMMPGRKRSMYVRWRRPGMDVGKTSTTDAAFAT